MTITRLLLGAAVLLVFTSSAFAITTYDNFSGYSQFWHPLGNPNTATYGETFTAPAGDTNLQSLTFYMAGPDATGDIKLHAYVATWTGTGAGTLLYTSPLVDYANTGNAALTFSPNINLASGGNYVAFLSVSQEYGQSTGTSYVSEGSNTIPGGGFVYYNNSGDFGALFTHAWDAQGIKPDWAIQATFGSSAVPEPATVGLLGLGVAGLFASRTLRRKQ